jgi:SPP1 family predicted phage head-tail adaptor
MSRKEEDLDMNAGTMDRRVIIQAKTVVVNNLGEPVETLVDVVTVWANKRNLTARERFTAQQRLAEVDTVFRIHYRTDVTPRTVVVCEGVTYDVQAVLEIGRREGLELQTTARL